MIELCMNLNICEKGQGALPISFLSFSFRDVTSISIKSSDYSLGMILVDWEFSVCIMCNKLGGQVLNTFEQQGNFGLYMRWDLTIFAPCFHIGNTVN